MWIQIFLKRILANNIDRDFRTKIFDWNNFENSNIKYKRNVNYRSLACSKFYGDFFPLLYYILFTT